MRVIETQRDTSYTSHKMPRIVHEEVVSDSEEVECCSCECEPWRTGLFPIDVDYSKCAVIETTGDGDWTKVKKPVTVIGMELFVNEVEEEDEYGEYGSLRVYFDKKSWNLKKNSFIYTDTGFLEGLKALLSALKIKASGLDYSEQGRQGRNYVDFDVDEDFIESWVAEGYVYDEFHVFTDNGRKLE
jgi:hypothetical protein